MKEARGKIKSSFLFLIPEGPFFSTLQKADSNRSRKMAFFQVELPLV
jgi:hypothetical protein